MSKLRVLRSKLKIAVGRFRNHNIDVINQSKVMTWRTPKWLIALIRKHFGAIGLDPCANHRKKHQFAKVNITGPRKTKKKRTWIDGTKNKNWNDGLSITWIGNGIVFANPPYGRELATWVAKAMQMFALEHRGYTRKVKGKREAIPYTEGDPVGDELFLLVPARTDTRWFRAMIKASPSAICFFTGRLTFSHKKPKRNATTGKRPKTPPAPFPSMLVYVGRRHQLFRAVFATQGLRKGWCPRV